MEFSPKLRAIANSTELELSQNHHHWTFAACSMLVCLGLAFACFFVNAERNRQTNTAQTTSIISFTPIPLSVVRRPSVVNPLYRPSSQPTVACLRRVVGHLALALSVVRRRCLFASVCLCWLFVSIHGHRVVAHSRQ